MDGITPRTRARKRRTRSKGSMTTLYVAMRCELLVTGDAAADPDRPGRLYRGTLGKGLYASNAAGASFGPVGEGTPYAGVAAVAAGPRRGASGEAVVYAGTESSALFRSKDWGEGRRICGSGREVGSYGGLC